MVGVYHGLDEGNDREVGLGRVGVLTRPVSDRKTRVEWSVKKW